MSILPKDFNLLHEIDPRHDLDRLKKTMESDSYLLEQELQSLALFERIKHLTRGAIVGLLLGVADKFIRGKNINVDAILILGIFDLLQMAIKQLLLKQSKVRL